MKTALDLEEEEEFKPVVLHITLETKEELNEMYARVNCNRDIKGAGHSLISKIGEVPYGNTFTNLFQTLQGGIFGRYKK